MKVKELLKFLETCNEETEIVFCQTQKIIGYSGEYNRTYLVGSAKIDRNFNQLKLISLHKELK